jgi:hypothetical protein
LFSCRADLVFHSSGAIDGAAQPLSRSPRLGYEQVDIRHPPILPAKTKRLTCFGVRIDNERTGGPVPMAAGDASFHAGWWTLHRAMPNTSNQMRKVMTIIFFADGSRLLEPRYQERRSRLESLFLGLSPGDAAASDLTPIVYSADAASYRAALRLRKRALVLESEDAERDRVGNRCV